MYTKGVLDYNTNKWVSLTYGFHQILEQLGKVSTEVPSQSQEVNLDELHVKLHWEQGLCF